jgi:hypothetical protein
MKASMVIPASRLRVFQELVKQHDLRFCGNPLVLGDSAHVHISSEHLGPGGENPFFADWGRLSRPIAEVQPPFLKRLMRAFKGRLLALARGV